MGAVCRDGAFHQVRVRGGGERWGSTQMQARARKRGGTQPSDHICVCSWLASCVTQPEQWLGCSFFAPTLRSRALQPEAMARRYRSTGGTCENGAGEAHAMMPSSDHDARCPVSRAVAMGPVGEVCRCTCLVNHACCSGIVQISHRLTWMREGGVGWWPSVSMPRRTASHQVHWHECC
jgi:hypothetical protein